jgi:signal transduction histidine kinase
LQQEFLAMASHELRNPLTAIMGHAQLMRLRKRYNEASLDSVYEQANVLDRLIDDLLLAARLAAERFELRLAETDLVAVARLAAATYGPAATVPVRVEAPDEPLTVLADRDRLG